MNLKNKKILITGATGGIGNCLVEKFDNFGSNIVATGTNEEKLANLKKELTLLLLGNFLETFSFLHFPLPTFMVWMPKTRSL